VLPVDALKIIETLDNLDASLIDKEVKALVWAKCFESLEQTRDFSSLGDKHLGLLMALVYKFRELKQVQNSALDQYFSRSHTTLT
jgi:hypothetical protein